MIFIVIQDAEYTMLYDDQATNYASLKSVYKKYDKSSRTQEFEKIVFGLNNPYKSIDEIKEENLRIGEIVDQVWRIIIPSSHQLAMQPDLAFKGVVNKQDKNSVSIVLKKGNEVEYEKALSQPYNFEYFCPITGDFVSVFAENTINASSKKHKALK